VSHEPADFDPSAILETLVRHGVDFVVIGGLAGMAHGSAFNTDDTDISYGRGGDNLERLAGALDKLEAKLRGPNLPPDLPFVADAETLRRGANFTFTTKHGILDLLADPAGAPRYADLAADAVAVEIAGVRVRVASLDHLIAMKEAAGRPKDVLMATEYRTLSDELRARPDR
jgi:hypothetical protein